MAGHFRGWEAGRGGLAQCLMFLRSSLIVLLIGQDLLGKLDVSFRALVSRGRRQGLTFRGWAPRQGEYCGE